MRGDSIKNGNLIAEALGSPEAEDRRQATSLLAALSPKQALPLLIQALGDTDWRVRKEATVAARAFVGERALVEDLIRILGPGDNVGLRNAAVEVLALAGESATPALAVAFAHLDADGKKLAVEALGRSRDTGAMEPLQHALSDADENVRQAAVEAIATLGPVALDRVQDVLVQTLEARDTFIRLTALEGLNKLGVAVPWPKLEPLLEDPALRGAALAAAALSDSPEAARPLVRALAEARGAAFREALVAVGRLSEGPLRSHVGEALAEAGTELGERFVAVAKARDKEPIERRATALVLAALSKAPGALDAAIAALGEEMLCEATTRAFHALGPTALPALLDRLGNASVDANVRVEILEVIASLAQELDPARVPWPDVLAALRAAANEAERRVATSAVPALARLGTEADFGLVADLTRSDGRAVARAAEAALARLTARFPEAARAFESSRRSDENAALAVSVILGALSTAAATQEGDLAFLAQVATAGSPAARRAAVTAVAEMGGPLAMEVLSFALADEEHDVRLSAARGLGRLCATVAASSARDTIPDLSPSSARRPGEILQLVERSGAPELVAATVRAIGEAMAGLESGPAEELLYALASFARHASSPVALAAVDALGLAPDEHGTTLALAAGLEHTGDDVVRAALVKLAHRTVGADSLVPALSHASAGVRLLAAELVAGRDSPALRDAIARRNAVETDRDVKAALERALQASPRREGGR